MAQKEKINILVLGVGTLSRWKTEIENANKENQLFEITCTVMHPYDCMLLLPEHNNENKIFERGFSQKPEYRSSQEPKNLINEFHAVIPRISGERVFEYGCNVLRQLTLMGVYSTAGAHSLETCSNKFKTSQLLALYDLPIPKQILLSNPTDYRQIIEMMGGLPLVGKLSRGSQGNGVFKLNDLEAAVTALQSMIKLNAEITLNRFVKTGENKFEDIRVWVINPFGENPVLHSMKRSTINDFRTNLSIDGIGTSVELTKKEKDICIKAAQIFNMDVCAVDLIRDIDKENEPFILELNGNPGLKIEQVIQKNVVRSVVDHVIETVINQRKELRAPEKAKSKSAKPKELNRSNSVYFKYRVAQAIQKLSDIELIQKARFSSDHSEMTDKLKKIIEDFSNEWMVDNS